VHDFQPEISYRMSRYSGGIVVPMVCIYLSMVKPSIDDKSFKI
jgi:hypothetical protein